MADLSLDDAVGQIAQAVLDGAGIERPFVFIVGAGVAAPSVPLAGDIVAHCRGVAEKYKRRALPAGAAAIDGYSHWFEHAYPSAKQRQNYLRSLIEGRPITSASLRLAHLLLDGRVANAVVTPNFDDFVSRALTLFGEPHVVCDHPGTVERIDPETGDIKVVHVHGSYWFYDCCNLKTEIQARASADQQVATSMSSLLDSLFARRSAIVLGYAGWEGDVIMSALQRRLRRVMPFNLYWFCYRTRDRDDMPAWIRTHPQVHFVVPDAATAGSGDDGTTQATAKAEGTLSAHRALARLIVAIDAQPPPLTDNPLAFFANSLKASLASALEDTEDIYSLRAVISKVERAAAARDDQQAAGGPTSTALARMQDALRRSQHREALMVSRDLDLDGLDTPTLRSVIRSLWDAATTLLDDSAEELTGYQRIVEGELVLSGRGESDAESMEIGAKAGVYSGITLSTMGQPLQAIAAYEGVARRFADASSEVLRDQVLRAKSSRAYELGELGRASDAVAAYQEIVSRYGTATEPAIVERVARSMVNLGLQYRTLKRYDDAIACYDDVVARFGASTEALLRGEVARALLNKGVALGLLGRHEESAAAHLEVLERFGSATEADIRDYVARAAANRGIAFYDAGRFEDALAANDEVERRFGADPHPGVEEFVVRALVNKTVVLSALDRNDAVIAVADDIVARFGDSKVPAIRSQVCRAMVNKGVALGALGRHEESAAAHDDVVRRFGDDAEPGTRETVARAMVNKGVALGDLGRRDESVAAYREVVTRYQDAPDAALRVHVAEAMVRQGKTLLDLKSVADGKRMLSRAIQLFANDAGAAAEVERARELLASVGDA